MVVVNEIVDKVNDARLSVSITSWSWEDLPVTPENILSRPESDLLHANDALISLYAVRPGEALLGKP